MASDLDTQLASLGSLLVDAAPPVEVAEILGSTRQPFLDDVEVDADVVELDLGPIDGSPRRRRRPVAGLVLAGLSAAAAITVIVVATNRDSPEQQGGPIASQPTGGTPAATCDEVQCLGLDRLPVVAGASDFYIGPSSLGTPTMNLSLFEQIARCTELTADGSSCAQLEGLAGVGLVDYAGDAASTPDTVERSQTSYLVTIGTTFTGVTPAEYAEQWPGLKADTIPAAEPTTVRGHDALEFYETVGRPAVVWQERPGVLVWVAVPPEREAELLAIAEGVQRVPGPTDIPWVQVVPEPGVAFDASNNNAEGMVVGRRGSLECVGLGYLASCGTDIASRMFVAGGMVATATPPEVAQVRVTFSSGSSLVEPEAKDGFTSRFVRVSVPDPATVELVEWLGADGTVIASTVPNPRDVASADPGAPPASS